MPTTITPMLSYEDAGAAADWLVVSGRLAVAYNHPLEGDELTALVVTLWRRS